jgi:hypothetical protein
VARSRLGQMIITRKRRFPCPDLLNSPETARQDCRLPTGRHYRFVT